MIEQRENVFTELTVTEREYCRDLKLTCQVFEVNERHNNLDRKDIDSATLFGNILEVDNRSIRFVLLLPRLF